MIPSSASFFIRSNESIRLSSAFARGIIIKLVSILLVDDKRKKILLTIWNNENRMFERGILIGKGIMITFRDIWTKLFMHPRLPTAGEASLQA